MNSNELIEEKVAKYVAGEASSEEAMQVEAWASQSGENETYLNACFQICSAPNPSKIAEAEETVWKNVETAISSEVTAARRRKLRTLGAAASIMLLLSGGILVKNRREWFGPPLYYEAVSTPKKIQLSDKTEIVLWPHSTVAMDKIYGGTSRKVVLTGSAAFSVKHDAAKPFVVMVGRLHIEDLGTQFTVTSFADSNRIEIAVQEGSVIAYDEGTSINLSNGDTAAYLATTRTFLRLGQARVDFRKQTGKAATIKSVSPVKSKVPVDSSPANVHTSQETRATKGDSIANLSLTDAAKVLGSPVAPIGSNTNKNDGLLKQSVQYRSLADSRCNLYSDVEYFVNEEAARKTFERIRSQNSNAQDAKELRAFGAAAFYETDGTNFYLLLFQKRNIILRVKISRLKSGTSTRALVQAVKDRAQALR